MQETGKREKNEQENGGGKEYEKKDYHIPYPLEPV